MYTSQFFAYPCAYLNDFEMPLVSVSATWQPIPSTNHSLCKQLTLHISSTPSPSHFTAMPSNLCHSLPEEKKFWLSTLSVPPIILYTSIHSSLNLRHSREISQCHSFTLFEPCSHWVFFLRSCSTGPSPSVTRGSRHETATLPCKAFAWTSLST